MRVAVSQEGAVTVLRPVGPIVAGELDELDQTLFELFNHWTKRLIVNMSDVSFMDSAGLELLVRNHRQFDSHGLIMKLCSLSDTTQKILSLTRLLRRFDTYPDAATAIRSFL